MMIGLLLTNFTIILNVGVKMGGSKTAKQRVGRLSTKIRKFDQIARLGPMQNSIPTPQSAIRLGPNDMVCLWMPLSLGKRGTVYWPQ